MPIFKIRNKDGLFSNGGSCPSFTKQGKSWAHRGHLSSHMTNCDSHTLKFYRDNKAEIVEYAMVEVAVSSLEDEIVKVKTRKVERELAEKARQDEYVKQRELCELQLLLRKYPQVTK